MCFDLALGNGNFSPPALKRMEPIQMSNVFRKPNDLLMSFREKCVLCLSLYLKRSLASLGDLLTKSTTVKITFPTARSPGSSRRRQPDDTKEGRISGEDWAEMRAQASPEVTSQLRLSVPKQSAGSCGQIFLCFRERRGKPGLMLNL